MTFQTRFLDGSKRPDDDKKSKLPIFCPLCSHELEGKLASLRACCSYCTHEFNLVESIP